jgi:hypothetical protein
MSEIRELTTAEMEQVAGGLFDASFTLNITSNDNISNTNSNTFATGVSQTALSAGNTVPISIGIASVVFPSPPVIG